VRLLPRRFRGALFTLAAVLMLGYLISQGRDPVVIVAAVLRLLGHLS